MKFSKTRIGAALLALLMCIGMFVSCGDDGITVDSVKEDPYKAVMDGSTKFTDALAEKYGDVFAVCEKLETGAGTYNVSLKGSDSNDASVAVSSSVNLNAVVDRANGKYSAKANVGVMGFSTDVSLWGDKNNIALNAPALFGDENYGLKLDTLESDLADSSLFEAISGGMSYEEFKAEMKNQMGMSVDELLDMFSKENIVAGYEQYYKDQEEIIRGFTPEVTEGKYADTDAIIVKYTLSADDVKKLSEAQIDMYEKIFGKILAWNGTDADAFADEFSKNIDEMYADGAILSWYLKKDNGMLIGEAMSIGETMSADLSFGADVAAKLDVSMVMDVNVDGNTMKLTADIDEVTDEGKGGFVMVSSVEGTGIDENMKPATVSVIRNDADGKYEVKMSSGDEEVATFFGTLTYSADELKLTVDSAASAEGETVDIGLAISAKTGGTVEAVPGYTSILDLTEEDLAAMGMLAEMIGGGSFEENVEFDDSGATY